MYVSDSVAPLSGLGGGWWDNPVVRVAQAVSTFGVSEAVRAGWHEDAWGYVKGAADWDEVGQVVACKLPTGAIVGGVTGGLASGGTAATVGATVGGGLQAALASKICPPGAAKVVVPAAPPPPPPPPKWYQRPEAPPLIVGGVLSLLVIGLALKRMKRQ